VSLFYNNDAQGSVRNIVNASNTMTDDERFDAFGMTVYHGGSGTLTPYGFVGKKGYQTDTSGLMLLGHRYYDAGIGRFLSRDPIHDGNNWYAYCGNNPLGKSDPTGLSATVTPNPPGWNDQWTQDNDNDFVSPNGDKWHWDPRKSDSPKDAEHDNHWDVNDRRSDGTKREGKYFPDSKRYKEDEASIGQHGRRLSDRELTSDKARQRAINDNKSRLGNPQTFRPTFNPPHINPAPTVGVGVAGILMYILRQLSQAPEL